MGFDEAKFLEAAREIGSLNLDGYEFFTESLKESVQCKIYRKYEEVSGLYEYKITGLLEDVGLDVCKNVYMDLEYRKKWDGYVKELYEFDDNGVKSIYWNVNYPWPMSNRDYIYTRELHEMEINSIPTVVVLAESNPVAKIPEKSGVVRVKEFHQSLVIQSDGKVGTKAFMHYFDNPGGSIPTWLINWAAKTGVPTFMNSMRDACLGYKKWISSKGT
ncbi:phosphatidylcholine transfer protein-like isoform X2 [Stylophora pistillata]|nr:phosphatidylcholine transfer protein-like isoform X2 [Stylophora pistillata]XP_022803365.1 phosphatidylcholine transfer protein-like isoform X2 [Stylophora pistillata]